MIRVSLARLNGRRALAVLEGDDDRCVDVYDALDPKQACLLAAKSLRAAAQRFELLALEPEPFKCDTHHKINRKRLPKDPK